MDDSPEIKVTIAFHPVTINFDAGSIDEAVAALTSMAPKLREARALDLGAEPSQETPPAAPDGKKPRKNAKNQPDPASASAPPPLPVPAPGNEPEATPAFLQRAPAPAASSLPPPPMPNAPPVAPAPPAPKAPDPTGALAKAVKAEVERRGDAMLPWLIQAGAVVPGAKFDEAAECMLYLAPDKLESIAKALGVSA